MDAVGGMVLCVDGLAGEDASQLQEWLSAVVEAVGAELLVSDDADAFKQVADEPGLAHLEIIGERCPEQGEQLRELFSRYQGASPPRRGERASVAYRMRLLM
jgi:hypothetical protein